MFGFVVAIENFKQVAESNNSEIFSGHPIVRQNFKQFLKISWLQTLAEADRVFKNHNGFHETTYSSIKERLSFIQFYVNIEPPCDYMEVKVHEIDERHQVQRKSLRLCLIRIYITIHRLQYC